MKGYKCVLFSFVVLGVTIPKVAGDCPAPPTIANGSPEANPSVTPGSVVEYTCITGYEFETEGSDVYTLECQQDETWAPIADCAKVRCPMLPTDAVLTSTDNRYNDQVTISCADDANFRIPEVDVQTTLTVTCQANKTWDFWDANKYSNGCIPIQCIYPHDPNSVGDNQVVTINNIVRFTCNSGYFYSDDTTEKDFKCNSNGDWETEGSIIWPCIPKECDDLVTVHNLTHVTLTPPTHFVGDKVKVACMDGHEFNDSSIEKQVVCQGNQTWEFIPFDCEPRLCPPVANISKANISSFDNAYPSVVNFSCFDGLFFPDGSTWRVTECNKYGKWSVAIPNCGDASSIETNFEEQEYDAKGAESFGIIAMSIVFVLLAAVVILDAVTFGMQIGFLKSNLTSRFDCLKPQEDDLESLDGDELMRASTISLGHGRITPAASTVDLQYGEKSKQSQLNTLEDVDIVNEELGQTAEIAGKKNVIPRTRLASAKSSIQRAVKKAADVQVFRKMTTIRKNEFASTGLPLGAQNYGKIVEMRPPSPTKEDSEESEDESEYTDESEEEEQAV